MPSARIDARSALLGDHPPACEVLHVGASAIILRPRAAAADDIVVTSRLAGLMPGGLELPSAEFVAWQSAARGSMRLEPALADVRRVDLTLTAGPVRPAAVALALRLLVASPRHPGFAVGPDDGARVARAALSSSDGLLRPMVREYVGLGTGSTPAGDDLLVGVCAGLRRVGRSAASERVARAAADIADRTTRSSRLFLRAAAEGRFATRVHRLAASIRCESQVGPIMRDLSNWGATSGADLAAGMLGASSVAQANGLARDRRGAA